MAGSGRLFCSCSFEVVGLTFGAFDLFRKTSNLMLVLIDSDLATVAITANLNLRVADLSAEVFLFFCKLTQFGEDVLDPRTIRIGISTVRRFLAATAEVAGRTVVLHFRTAVIAIDA